MMEAIKEIEKVNTRKRKVRLALGRVLTSFGEILPEVVEKYLFERDRGRTAGKGFIADDFYIELRCPICGCLLGVNDRRCPYCKQRVRIKNVFVNLARDPHFKVVDYNMEIFYSKGYMPFFNIRRSKIHEAMQITKKYLESHPELYSKQYIKKLTYRYDCKEPRLYFRTHEDVQIFANSLMQIPDLTDNEKEIIKKGLIRSQLLPESEKNKRYIPPDRTKGITEKILKEHYTLQQGSIIGGRAAAGMRKNNVWKKIINEY